VAASFGAGVASSLGMEDADEEQPITAARPSKAKRMIGS
jgi:hypothetical protein